MSSATTVDDAQENTSEVEVVGAGDGDASVPIIKPAPIYNKKGEEHDLDSVVVNAVVRKGAREESIMNSLGVYVEALERESHKYFCLADATCRRKKKMVPCKGGDRSNVNSHLKNMHGLQGMGGVVKGGKEEGSER